MGFWSWKYTASDVADWFDSNDEKYWRDHDEWLISTQLRGETNPVFVFATWFNDRMATLPQRVGSSLTSGVVDVLRLGSDIDFSSKMGIAKGVFLNLTRIATIAGPISKAVGAGGRYAGLLATSSLEEIAGAAKPCSFVSANNVLSYMKGRTVQLFAVVDDVIKVRGANKGIGREALLASEEVQAALAKFGVTWERLSNLGSIDDVLKAAKSSEGPILFSIEWEMNGRTARHALTAVKDMAGRVRILDYVEESSEAFKGFSSIAEMAQARPEWGEGFANAILRTSQPVVAFSSRYLRLLEFGGGLYRFGLPIAMGLKWLKGETQDDKVFAIGRSAWRYLRSKWDDESPTPPLATNPPPVAAELHIPPVPQVNARALGVSPLSRAASSAPRIDWLTGVQFRLKYLGYYRGPVHGNNDHSTKAAVLAFQKEWFIDSKQWDSIPGPITQAMLYSVLGW
ncbi:hypothetical protein GCM10007874_50590 [Labrys miyagiensis]|uniref:Peptidoglycan binding-like domain-containing protein n=1 Tax=Labrys miyagiensis TaxID=346912 RepID=A0ABQ6CR24_9HYPH|nr:peptidoglycan-binding domain-containing protein [Labrys miyagiensis]GLS22042.1 hypothetical protein GCM10007874_50590 [Labrys miyagiensis]